MSGRRGFSAVEVMVAVMVAATVGIPLLTLLMQERDTEQRSRFEYLALIAARDAAFEARALAACGKVGAAAHDFEALKGSPLKRLAPLFADGKGPTTTEYSSDQARVSLEVKLEAAPTGGQPQLGTVTARWIDPDLAAKDRRRSTLSLTFGMMKPPGVP